MSHLPPESRDYFVRKANSALSGEQRTPVVLIAPMGGTWQAVIELEMKPKDNEKQCLKIVHALSRDPQIPQVAEVHVNLIRYFTPPVYGIQQGYGNTFNTTCFVPKEQEHIIYSCSIKRDALIKGEEPTFYVEDGARINEKGILYSLLNGRRDIDVYPSNRTTEWNEAFGFLAAQLFFCKSS